MTVAEFVDGARVRGLIRRVPLLCGLVMMTEGVDLNGIGYAGPLISKAYHISPQSLGLIYGATVVGSLVGAIMVAPLADRIGRRSILVGSNLILGVSTGLTPLASHDWQLFLVRLMIGAGFGAAVPCVFAMTADYIPRRLRAMSINAVTAGVALGVVFAGLAAAFIIPAFGWRLMMYLSGVGSLATAAALVMLLPESLSFLVRRHADRPRAQALFARLKREQGAAATMQFAPEALSGSSSPLLLITQGRLCTTATLFVALLAAYAVQTFLSYWLPTLLLSGGATMTAAGLISATSKGLSICGGVGLGFVMDRRGPWRVLPIVYILAAAVILSLGFAVALPALALVLLILSSALVDSSFGGATALSAMAYPSAMRATAAGWMTGMARLIGGGGGTTLGGWLVAQHWAPDRTAFLMAAPLIAGAIVLGLAVRRGQTPGAAAGSASL